MNILIPDSWLRDYIKTKATPKDIAKALSLHAFSVEKMETCVDGDVVYEIEITPNRGDALSVLGIARELRAVLPRLQFEVEWLKNGGSIFEEKNQDNLEVIIENKTLVPRFSAVVLDVESIKHSSEKIASRLKKVGIRPINAVVDMTNYLMIELGQPMHVFDFAKIGKAKMIVRESHAGEKLVTLDGVERILPEGVIVIEDGNGRLIDLCGIMGAKNSEVDENTKRVLFFVQIYDPVRIRKASMTLGHRTEAALRFEKGIDFNGVISGLYAGVAMLKASSNAHVTSRLIDLINIPYVADTVTLDYEKINQVAGIAIETSEVDRTLVDLGFTLKDGKVSVPSWRKGDITISEDLAEEIIRMYGYYKLPSVLPTGAIPTAFEDPRFYWEDKAKDYLKYMGFFEVYTYSAVSAELSGEAGIPLANPLSEDFCVLRTSLIPQLISVIRKNKSAKDSLKVFELASVYLPNASDLPHQPMKLGLAALNVDYFYFKGYVESLFEELGIKEYPPFEITMAGNILTCELDFDTLVRKATKTKVYAPISKFNAIKEDMTLTIPQGIGYKEVQSKILSADERVASAVFKGFYKNSITFTVEYLDRTKQLTSEDAQKIRARILGTLEKQLNVTLKLQ